MYIRNIEINNKVKVVRGNTTFYRKNTKWMSLYNCDECNTDFTRDTKFERTVGKNQCIEEKKKRNTYCNKCYHPGITNKQSVLSRMSKRTVGEKKKDKAGYVYIYVGPDWGYHKDWNMQGKNWVREHAYIISEQLNRMLQPGEHVHHIDGDKANNDIDNLVLLTVSEHKLAHDSYELVGRELLDRGIIKFDRHTNKYVIID
jgi:hypothetical protein